MRDTSDRIVLEKGLYNELQSSIGQGFPLYQQATNVYPNVPKQKGSQRSLNSSSSNRSSNSSSGMKPSFPPLLTSFTLRQTKQAVRQDTRPIPITSELRGNLQQVLGDSNFKLLEQNIGFVEKQSSLQTGTLGSTSFSGSTTLPPASATSSATLFQTVFGDQSKPSYKFTTRPHFSKVKNQFFWPNMTNPLCEIPVQVTLPSHVRDLKSWIDAYGEPTVEHIPTGSMSTFRPTRRRFGKEKSRGVELVQTATGAEWKKTFDAKRKEFGR